MTKHLFDETPIRQHYTYWWPMAVERQTGVLYRRYKFDPDVEAEGWWLPVHPGEVKLLDIPPGTPYVIDGLAPVLCPCGNDLLTVAQPDSYETCGACSACGFKSTLHSG